ncbi:hypothetical protein QYM36_001926 [Artemia franciscana]|uniref:Uncharacterized protein n=1 Tax=Artemia franciscana TaxID=6661 RepID=A0AA88LAN1_ARTSF|nr:hypothetical protein QYM36_001926 [Artemia franciscana]
MYFFLALTGLSPMEADTASRNINLCQQLKMVKIRLKTKTIKSEDFKTFEDQLYNFKFLKASRETVEDLCSVYELVLQNVESSEMFYSLYVILEGYFIKNMNNLKKYPGLVNLISNDCASFSFKFDLRLPFILLLSSVCTDHGADCQFFQVLTVKKKNSVYKMLLDEYIQAIQFIIDENYGECRCYEEAIQQLYFSIEDNYSNYRSSLAQSIHFVSPNVLSSVNLSLHCDDPSKVENLTLVWAKRIESIVPVFRKILLNGPLNEGVKTWTVLGLHSVKNFLALLNKSSGEIDAYLEFLSSKEQNRNITALEEKILKLIAKE